MGNNKCQETCQSKASYFKAGMRTNLTLGTHAYDQIYLLNGHEMTPRSVSCYIRHKTLELIKLYGRC